MAKAIPYLSGWFNWGNGWASKPKVTGSSPVGRTILLFRKTSLVQQISQDLSFYLSISVIIIFVKLHSNRRHKEVA